MAGGERFDLAVIGGGIGGLATAALAQRAGLSVVLFEAHTRLGGCAGYFPRGPFTFDAGATALMGLGAGEPIGDLLRVVGLAFEGVLSPIYRVHLPDRTLDIPAGGPMPTVDPGRAEAEGRFWRLQEAVGSALFRAAGRIPRLPARGAGDLLHDLRILGIPGVLGAATSALTVDQVLRLFGLGHNGPFRALVSILLQDTAQAGPETVPFANAAACLHAYRAGLSRPAGGMRALAEGLGRRFAELGGDLQTAAIVDRVDALAGGGFGIETRRRRRVEARHVALNLPLDRAAGLLGRPLRGRLARNERRSRAAWGACTAYLAIDRLAVPDDTPLFHQVLQRHDLPHHDGNNVLISVAPLEDDAYGPPGLRVATLSTHTLPGDWAGLDRHAYDSRKAEIRDRLLSALGRALPEAPGRLVHAEFATPRSFERYTRRREGRVGGPPLSRLNSNALAVGSDALGPGLWLVGDSVFPGQGTLAVVVSAIRAVERIAGVSWAVLRGPSPSAAAAGEMGALTRGESADA